MTYAFYFVFVILAYTFLRKEQWQKAWDFSILIGVLVSLVGIFQYLGLFSQILAAAESRPASTLGNPILLAIYLLLLFFITLSFLLKEKITWKKAFYTISFLIFTYTIFITGTRAVYLGMVIGGLYYLLAWPKKLKIIKVIAGLALALIVLVVFYVNFFPKQAPQQNRVLNTLETRLSIKNALNDERFHAWQVAFSALKNKPVLGFGPENFAVGFDKNYDPKIIGSFWWDKSHNIILDTGVEAGILGIIAYLALFITLFWQLQKVKSNENTLVIHGVQATLIGYLIANFFSFDSFGTYLVFFLLIGYSLHLTNLENVNENKIVAMQETTGKKAVLAFAFIVLLVFLFQYNLKPFLINVNLNKAEILVAQKNCNQALNLLENNLNNKSFLNAYIRINYANLAKTCSTLYPENNLTYLKKGQELIKQAIKIQPLYTRYYIYLGSVNNVLAVTEKDASTKQVFIDQANFYLQKALSLAPKHQEIFIEQAKVAITASSFEQAKNYSQACILLNPNYANCYWQLALSEIYLKDVFSAQKNIQLAKDKGYRIGLKENLGQLADAYNSIPDYQNLALVYEQLILNVDPNNAQYHSSLAFFYKQLGEYKKARQEALKVLQLSPESKPAVDDFLKNLF